MSSSLSLVHDLIKQKRPYMAAEKMRCILKTHTFDSVALREILANTKHILEPIFSIDVGAGIQLCGTIIKIGKANPEIAIDSVKVVSAFMPYVEEMDLRIAGNFYKSMNEICRRALQSPSEHEAELNLYASRFFEALQRIYPPKPQPKSFGEKQFFSSQCAL